MTQIYLISPAQLELKKFCEELEIILSTGLVPIFQLRLKDIDSQIVKVFAKKIQEICRKNNTKFIVNDDINLALELNANGVHLGIDDQKNLAENFFEITKQNKNFSISLSCYDSKDLAIKANQLGVDFISFGAFFPSKTKISRGSPKPDIIDWAKEKLNSKIIAIGGINAQNCHQLISRNVDYIALISHIWQHPKGSLFAIKEFDKIIQSNNSKI